MIGFLTSRAGIYAALVVLALGAVGGIYWKGLRDAARAAELEKLERQAEVWRDLHRIGRDVRILEDETLAERLSRPR